MQLPKAEDLRAIFAAARDNGVTRLRIGALEVDLAPAATLGIVDAINQVAPLPADEDPIAIIRGTVRPKSSAEPDDILEAMAEGRPIVTPLVGPDPTSPQ